MGIDFRIGYSIINGMSEYCQCCIEHLSIDFLLWYCVFYIGVSDHNSQFKIILLYYNNMYILVLRGSDQLAMSNLPNK